MQKLAIFGGTFSPVHWGHLLMAEIALDQFALDRVIWVPTYHPAYKASADLLDFRYRLEMVQLAIDSHPHFTLSPIEQALPSPSHAIDTLDHLQSIYPDNYWYWIIGIDAFQMLPRWFRCRELVSRCCWLVTPRWSKQEPERRTQEAKINLSSSSPHSIPSSLTLLDENAVGRSLALAICQQVSAKLAMESLELNWHLLDVPLVGISSSLVRQRCRDRQSIRYMVPESVRDYITRQGLYQVETASEEQGSDS